jgi:hypothetical protein
MNLRALVPQELTNLPEPWRVTSEFKRNDSVARLDRSPDAFAVSLDVLKRTFGALAYLPDPATLSLPDQIGDAYGFAIHQIADEIGILDDLNEAPFVQYLTDLLENAPDASTVNALAQAWIYSICESISRSVLRWLGSHWQQFPLDQRPRLLQIAEDAWTSIPEDLLITLLATISTVARDDSLALLTLAETRGATPAIRSVAKRYREWTATRDTSGS